MRFQRLDVPPLPIGARSEVPARIHDGQRAACAAGVPADHFEGCADIFGHEPTVLAQQSAELVEGPFGLFDRFLGAFQLQRVAAGDDLYAQRVAHGAEELIARAEQDHRFFAAVERERLRDRFCFRHRKAPEFPHPVVTPPRRRGSTREPKIGHRPGEQD